MTVPAPLVSARRWRLAPGRSIKRRMVGVFLLLAVVLAAVFIVGAQRAFTLGWREAARPLLTDYVDRLAAELTGPDGGPPSIARATALAQRLPVTVRIEGPRVNWQSRPDPHTDPHTDADTDPDGDTDPARWLDQRPSRTAGLTGPADDPHWARLLERRTADGHTLRFGLNPDALTRQQRRIGGALAALLLATLLAYVYVRHLLRPLDDIAAGAQRFGAGEFKPPIPVRHPHRPDELGQLAATVNTMGDNIRQMLDAKRALLLAISHELRSPITRARLHVELLPDSADAQPQRQALLHELRQMADLVNDLLESERLASGHGALQREPVSLARLAANVVQDMQAGQAAVAATVLHAPPDLPDLRLDRSRMRLLLRNLLDNAWRHGADAAQPPEIWLSSFSGSPDDAQPRPGGQRLVVRDHGPGVPEDQCGQLAQAFYRPDSARSRASGGVGLGLYLCRLVAQAHGGSFTVANAHPGLRVTVDLPNV